MIKQPLSRPSTAPIALLLTVGVVCLGLSASFPTSYEISTANPYVPGEPMSFTVTSSGIDPAATAIFVGLLAVSVIAFAAAGRLIYRRRR